MFCKNCGNEISEDSLFCPECGTNVNSTHKNNKFLVIIKNKKILIVIASVILISVIFILCISMNSIHSSPKKLATTWVESCYAVDIDSLVKCLPSFTLKEAADYYDLPTDASKREISNAIKKDYRYDVADEITIISVEEIRRYNVGRDDIDFTRYMTISEYESIINISEVEKRNPFLIHGKIASFMAKDKFGIDNGDILKAVHNHTTGRPDMTPLEKIIFIADYIEPSRKLQKNLNEIRELAFENLDETLVWILKDTLEYLSNKGGEIDPMTQKTYDYYCAK